MDKNLDLVWFDLGDQLGIRPVSFWGSDWFLRKHGVTPRFWDTCPDPLLYPHDIGSKVVIGAIKDGLKVEVRC